MLPALKAGATALRTALQCAFVCPVSMFSPPRNCRRSTDELSQVSKHSSLSKNAAATAVRTIIGVACMPCQHLAQIHRSYGVFNEDEALANMLHHKPPWHVPKHACSISMHVMLLHAMPACRGRKVMMMHNGCDDMCSMAWLWWAGLHNLVTDRSPGPGKSMGSAACPPPCSAALASPAPGL